MADLDRIKRNVSKMVGMGAPESDIDAYIAGEGTTIDEVQSWGRATVAQEGRPDVNPALQPIANLPGDYNEARRGAQDMMSSGLEDLTAPTGGDLGASALAALKGVGKLGMGAAGYVASPISGALRSIVGRPGEEVLGIPKEYSEFAAGLALPIPKRIPLPSFARAERGAEAAAPTAEQLVASYKAAKESPEVAAVQIRPESAARNADVTAAELNTEWLDPTLAPKTHYILNKLQGGPEGSTVTMANVDSARRLLGRLAGRGDEEAAAASIAKRKLDDWMGSMSPADAISGDVPAAQAIMQGGRGDYAAAKLSEALDSRRAEAELRASGIYSGLNQQNTIKQKVTQFLLSDESRGLTTTQRAAAEAVVRGDAPENVIRYVAHLLGGGGGMGTVGAGAAGNIVAGPLGTLAPLGGFGLNRLGAALTSRNAARVSELIRSESPLGRRLAGPASDFEKAASEAQISPTARNLSRLMIASRNLSNNLKDAEIFVSPNELLKSLYGNQPAAADDQ